MTALPFDKRDGVIWMNGQFIPWQDAKVHVLTHGLHYASSVFEGVRAYGGKIFKLEEHTDRLFYSAELLGMKIPFTKDELNQAQIDAVAKGGVPDTYIRPVVWRGSEMMAISAQHTTIHVAIATWAMPSYFDPAEKLKGIKLDISKWRRPDPQTIPCHAKAAGLYMICTLSKHNAEAKGLTDSMMLDYRGYVAEATGANIFFIKDGEIHTPKPDCFLNGITRQTVVDIAKRRGITVHERHILPEELSSFEECFLTGTAAEVTPVSKIEDFTFTPGAISKTLMDDYTAEVRPSSEGKIAANG